VALYKDHLFLISLSLLIAMPAAFYASSAWLDNYPYRIEVGLGIFVYAGLFVLLIAGLTISHQTIKTALLNPVDSLRAE
jgi:putative ABC transport system permease protein